eukprot:1184712-Prorocentrum_minimum.AAC.2
MTVTQNSAVRHRPRYVADIRVGPVRPSRRQNNAELRLYHGGQGSGEASVTCLSHRGGGEALRLLLPSPAPAPPPERLRGPILVTRESPPARRLRPPQMTETERGRRTASDPLFTPS